MEIGKGKLKSLLRLAYMAGGRYYSKPHIKDEEARKAIGKTQSFDAWYKSQNLM